MNLANQGQIPKLKPFKVKPPSKISYLKISAFTNCLTIIAVRNYYLRRFSMPGFRQRFFHQNSLYQDSPKFNNAKVSGFTVYCVHETCGSC